MNELLKKRLKRDYTEARKCVIEGFPDAHTVWLKVGGQAFDVTPHGCENIEDAEWMRDQLAGALLKIVEAVNQ